MSDLRLASLGVAAADPLSPVMRFWFLDFVVGRNKFRRGPGDREREGAVFMGSVMLAARQYREVSPGHVVMAWEE